MYSVRIVWDAQYFLDIQVCGLTQLSFNDCREANDLSLFIAVLLWLIILPIASHFWLRQLLYEALPMFTSFWLSFWGYILLDVGLFHPCKYWPLFGFNLTKVWSLVVPFYFLAFFLSLSCDISLTHWTGYTQHESRQHVADIRFERLYPFSFDGCVLQAICSYHTSWRNDLIMATEVDAVLDGVVVVIFKAGCNNNKDY